MGPLDGPLSAERPPARPKKPAVHHIPTSPERGRAKAWLVRVLGYIIPYHILYWYQFSLRHDTFWLPKGGKILKIPEYR